MSAHAVRVCFTTPRDAWLDARKTGVGSSDSPALILGTHFGRTAMSLFAEKLGIDDGRDDDAEGLTLGTELEPFIRERFMRETGRFLLSDSGLYRSTRWPFMLASPDGFLLDEESRNVGVFEGKTAGSLGDWSDGVPRKYWIQCQHQMAVHWLPSCACAVLAGGHGGLAFRWADVPMDERFIVDDLVPACERFWRCVETRTPPDVDGTEATAKALARLYASPTEETVALGGDMLELWEEHAMAADTLKRVEEQKTLIENRIKARLGAASYGFLPNGSGWTWRQQTRNDPPREAKSHTFRVLRRKESK